MMEHRLCHCPSIGVREQAVLGMLRIIGKDKTFTVSSEAQKALCFNLIFSTPHEAEPLRQYCLMLIKLRSLEPFVEDLKMKSISGTLAETWSKGDVQLWLLCIGFSRYHKISGVDAGQLSNITLGDLKSKFDVVDLAVRCALWHSISDFSARACMTIDNDSSVFQVSDRHF